VHEMFFLHVVEVFALKSDTWSKQNNGMPLFWDLLRSQGDILNCSLKTYHSKEARISNTKSRNFTHIVSRATHVQQQCVHVRQAGISWGVGREEHFVWITFSTARTFNRGLELTWIEGERFECPLSITM
jgi:hypothetical protein